MANQIYTMEYANLFAGAAPDNDQASNHLVISEVKLPSMDVQYVDHRAGGAPVAIEIDTIMARLESTFVLIGITPQVMELLYSWEPAQDLFFIYGSIRDQQRGNALQAAAVLRGQLGRVDPQNFRKGDAMHTNYSIRGITHYEFKIGDEMIYFWDFFTNQRLVGGVDQNRFINNNLHIPNTAVQTLLPATTPTIGA